MKPPTKLIAAAVITVLVITISSSATDHVKTLKELSTGWWKTAYAVTSAEALLTVIIVMALIAIIVMCYADRADYYSIHTQKHTGVHTCTHLHAEAHTCIA